jgi:hypothetical protein
MVLTILKNMLWALQKPLHTKLKAATVLLITSAQDSIADGDLNNARQVLNVAKHLLSEINNGNLVGTVKRKAREA